MQFDFGQNWLEFSREELTAERVDGARRDFDELLRGVSLCNRTFLDIGFGQGLSLLCAAEKGARVIGNDINPKCRDALEYSSIHFPEHRIDRVELVIGSILDDDIVRRLRALTDGFGFDVVHSWGVLHHTGNMPVALANAAALVRPGGHLIVALYNRHWSSPIWRVIKRAYCRSGPLLQGAMIRVFYPIIWLAKLVVMRTKPTDKKRGMDFRRDVIDWIGGYPYEYASVQEISRWCDSMGFETKRTHLAEVPTGCNEFVLVKARHDLSTKSI